MSQFNRSNELANWHYSCSEELTLQKELVGSECPSSLDVALLRGSSFD